VKRTSSTSQTVKRSLVIAGRKKSISLEEVVWRSLKEIAARLDVTLLALLTNIASTKYQGSLSVAVMRGGRVPTKLGGDLIKKAAMKRVHFGTARNDRRKRHVGGHRPGNQLHRRFALSTLRRCRGGHGTGSAKADAHQDYVEELIHFLRK
jgi:hypothetical protein